MQAVQILAPYPPHPAFLKRLSKSRFTAFLTTCVNESRGSNDSNDVLVQSAYEKLNEFIDEFCGIEENLQMCDASNFFTSASD
jgi:hypothetical protein